jgi:hypothetical protein
VGNSLQKGLVCTDPPKKLGGAKAILESNSLPVGLSYPLILVLNCLKYSHTFANQVKSEFLIGSIFGGAYSKQLLACHTSITKPTLSFQRKRER